MAANRKESSKKLSFNNDFSDMRVNDLRILLHKRGLDVDGSREMLISRLEEEVVEPEEVV